MYFYLLKDQKNNKTKYFFSKDIEAKKIENDENQNFKVVFIAYVEMLQDDSILDGPILDLKRSLDQYSSTNQSVDSISIDLMMKTLHEYFEIAWSSDLPIMRPKEHAPSVIPLKSMFAAN